MNNYLNVKKLKDDNEMLAYFSETNLFAFKNFL